MREDIPVEEFESRLTPSKELRSPYGKPFSAWEFGTTIKNFNVKSAPGMDGLALKQFNFRNLGETPWFDSFPRLEEDSVVSV